MKTYRWIQSNQLNLVTKGDGPVACSHMHVLAASNHRSKHWNHHFPQLPNRREEVSKAIILLKTCHLIIWDYLYILLFQGKGAGRKMPECYVTAAPIWVNTGGSDNLVFPRPHCKTTSAYKLYLLLEASIQSQIVARHVLTNKPEEREISILGACQQHRASCQQRETSVLHSRYWTFTLAISMAVRTW